MSEKLVAALDAALAGAVQNYPRDASVVVQFAAGDYAKVTEALAEAKAELAPAPTPVAEEPVAEEAVAGGRKRRA